MSVSGGGAHTQGSPDESVHAPPTSYDTSRCTDADDRRRPVTLPSDHVSSPGSVDRHHSLIQPSFYSLHGIVHGSPSSSIRPCMAITHTLSTIPRSTRDSMESSSATPGARDSIRIPFSRSHATLMAYSHRHWSYVIYGIKKRKKKPPTAYKTKPMHGWASSLKSTHQNHGPERFAVH
jgi:hypothetical protein